MDRNWEEKIFNEEYIREQARIAYRSDLEKAKAKKKNEWHPVSIIGIAGLIFFYILEMWGFQYVSYIFLGLGIIAVLYVIICVVKGLFKTSSSQR